MSLPGFRNWPIESIHLRLFPKFNGNKEAMGVCLVPVKTFFYNSVAVYVRSRRDQRKKCKVNTGYTHATC